MNRPPRLQHSIGFVQACKRQMSVYCCLPKGQQHATVARLRTVGASVVQACKRAGCLA